jgi:PAS domain S-box-containing protein
LKETYQTIFETTGTAMVVYGPDMVITLANKEFEKLSGYSAAELEGKISLIQFVAPENVEQVKADHQLRLSTPLEAPRNAEFHFVGRSGEIIDVYLTVATVPGKKASVLSLMDITERKKNERFRIKSEERYRTLFEDSHDAIVITAPDGRFVDVNKACRHLFQYTKDELMAMTAEALYKNPLDRKKILEEIASTHSVRDYEVKLCKKDRTVMDCHMTVTVWHDDQENVLGYQAIIRDITEKKRAEETIWRLAYHDSLTGLPNRLLFLDRLDVAIARAYRNEKKLAIMMLDLDRFKDVNDSLGHNIDVLVKSKIGITS